MNSVNQEEETSLLNAIYDRYSEISESDLQDFISFTSSSSSCSSNTTSSSQSSSPVSDSNNNSIGNKLQHQQSDVSFYIPSAYSPRKTKNVNIKTSISLVFSNLCISHIGDDNELENICKNVLELDLSKNELNDWNEIRRLLIALKKLRLLNLSSNKFSYYKPFETNNSNKENEVFYSRNTEKDSFDLLNYVWPIEQTFDQLNTLILNSCFLDLKLIESLLERLPNLNELHLASNNYSVVNFSKKFLKNSIKILYFNNNLLNNWLDVCKLGKSFPNLENLVLSENNLENFSINIDKNSFSGDNNEFFFKEFNEPLTNSNLFKNLKILLINKLKINDWLAIDQLREFPQLKHVRIQNIPLLETLNDEEKYYVLVGHLDDSIDSLNGSKITNDDKENCERKYIRYFMDSSFKPNRYYELETKHGKLDPLADVNMDIRKRVQVKIKYNDKHVYEKIDVRQTVGEFKKYLEKFVGHPSSRFKVFYIDIEACSMSIYGPEELKHTNRCLYSFNIRDDDEFEIDLKPAPALHATTSEYQFQYQHLHHLHYHHYNSHMNNNSHYQVPSFNSLNQTNKIKSRKIQAEQGSLNSNTNNSNNSTLKRSKPGLVTSPKLINKSKEIVLNNKKSFPIRQEVSICSASLPCNLNNLKDNELNNSNDSKLVLFSTSNQKDNE